MNYFALLELEEQYDIDNEKLKMKYLQALKQYHPDRAQIGQAKEYIEKSMKINEAYKVLSDSYERAKYLLIRKGQKFDDAALKNTLTSGELELILNDYELIDNIEDISELKNKEVAINQDLVELNSKLNQAFLVDNFTKALDYTVRLKYLTNLVRNIKLKIKNASN